MFSLGAVVFSLVVAVAGMGSGVSAAQAQQCPAQGQYQLTITAGNITCGDAYAVAEEYNIAGEKYQDIREFSCYTGDSQTDPLIFQCVSDNTEFGVYWA